MPDRSGIECANPKHTRKVARAGGITSCYRCLAYRPETPSGCFFVKTPKPTPPPEKGHTS